MYQNISTNNAAGILADDPDSTFSFSGAHALVSYFEQVEAESGEPMEFDPIAIRCEWTEASSYEDALRNIDPGEADLLLNQAFDEADERAQTGEDSGDPDEIDPDTCIEEQAEEYLRDYFSIRFDGGILIRDR